MRRYSEPIEVRAERRVVVGPDGLADSFGGADLRPQAFIWRARLYVVRQVLAHWSTRRAWWRDALDPAPGQPTGIAGASSEQHVWRVEASPGQAFAVGVFDLEHDPGPGPDLGVSPGPDDGPEHGPEPSRDSAGAASGLGPVSASASASVSRWRLVRVAD